MWYNVLTGDEYFVGFNNNPITLSAGELLIFADRRINFNTSVDEVIDNNRLQVIYPTRTSGKVYITDSSWQHEAVVFNVNGQALSTQRNVSEIDLSAYQPGVYLIRLSSPEGSVTARVVKE